MEAVAELRGCQLPVRTMPIALAQLATVNSQLCTSQYCRPLIRLPLWPGRAEEAAVVAHQQVGLDALDHVERDADDDQQAGAAEERGDLRTGCPSQALIAVGMTAMTQRNAAPT